MVKVEIVEEKDNVDGASPYASSSSSHTSSTTSISSVSSEVEAPETFYDRIAALVDIVPPTTRYTIQSRASKTASILKRTGKLVGNLVWIATTSALLVGLPLALILEDETKIVAQEKEMMAQQQGAQQVRFTAITVVALPVSYDFIRIHVFSHRCSLDTRRRQVPIPTRPRRKALFLPASDSGRTWRSGVGAVEGGGEGRRLL